MRVLIWIVEETWKPTVAWASAFLPADADITLLSVPPGEAEAVARGARHGLLGRPHHPSAASLGVISEQSARDLLADAQSLLGREAVVETRRGRIEREVVAAAEGMDLLVLARDGARAHGGPRSLGATARFVVDHVPCAVFLVWPDAPPPATTIASTHRYS
jgi:nucleotide-binding universal stress UspA family protein